MTPTRVSVLVVTAAISLLVSWLVLRSVYASLPPLPWTAAVAMLLLAIAEALSGRNLRARIRGGPGLKPIAPLAADPGRMAALAKASSHAAAVIGGLAAGALVYLTSSLSKSVPRSDAITSGGTLLAAVLLVAAALYLEHSCRVPSDDDQDPDPDRQRAPR
jgi:4-amino-4-deoxy-L-arabinose transferase-like glycosyltransferase